MNRAAWRALAVVLAIIAAPLWMLVGAWWGLQELWDRLTDFWWSA